MKREAMKSYRGILPAAILVLTTSGISDLQGQEGPSTSQVLNMQQTVTTATPGFPSSLYMYQVLGGAQSSAQARALTGTISLENQTANFSEVLLILAYWQGDCPANDLSLSMVRNFLWSDILKNPSQSNSRLLVDLHFPYPLPMTGCVGLYINGGPLVQGAVTMSANLNLTYEPASSNANTVIDLSGEYCFGQDGGCENATADNTQVFAVPTLMPAGHIVQLFGNISDSTFDGTQDVSPFPTGEDWGAFNDFYLLPGGCGNFGGNVNSQGFANPVSRATFDSWLPPNALHIGSVPLARRIPPGAMGRATLQSQVENILSVPVLANAGDCMLVVYGRKGNGATDNETQVKLC